MDHVETKIFGMLLKQYRQRKQLTQLDLAYKIGKLSRGNVQAWESSLFLPSDRETVLALARALQLAQSETDELLLAAHYPQEFHTQGTRFSAAQTEKSLSLADVYVHEQEDTPMLDITLHNNSAKSVLPIQIQVDILDVGEFFDCDEDDDDAPTRAIIIVSNIYDVNLSPALKGKQVSVKIAHQLRADEADRFQLRIGQSINNDRLAYVWYYVKITIFCSEPEYTIETNPILLSLPPVDTDIADVWADIHTHCAEQNRATLRRMSKLSAFRSASVDATICQVLEE